jgi:hypothetical protein
LRGVPVPGPDISCLVDGMGHILLVGIKVAVAVVKGVLEWHELVGTDENWPHLVRVLLLADETRMVKVQADHVVGRPAQLLGG